MSTAEDPKLLMKRLAAKHFSNELEALEDEKDLHRKMKNVN